MNFVNNHVELLLFKQSQIRDHRSPPKNGFRQLFTASMFCQTENHETTLCLLMSYHVLPFPVENARQHTTRSNTRYIVQCSDTLYIYSMWTVEQIFTDAESLRKPGNDGENFNELAYWRYCSITDHWLRISPEVWWNVWWNGGFLKWGRHQSSSIFSWKFPGSPMTMPARSGRCGVALLRAWDA